jgi:hypothetical protein
MTQKYSIRLVALSLAIGLGFGVQVASQDHMVQLAVHAVKLTYCPV